MTGGQRSKAPDEKFCTSGGEPIKQEAVICPECGVRQQTNSGSGDGDPGVAALLAAVGFLIPLLAGAGQFYNGDILKGIAITIVQLINVALAFVIIGAFTYPIVGIVAIIDACNSAS